jgi:hypothetical protein
MSYKQVAVICRSACSAPNMSRADLRSLNVREASLLRGFGLLLALTGELSWLSIVVPKAGLLIPLARFHLADRNRIPDYTREGGRPMTLSLDLAKRKQKEVTL